MAWVRGRRRTGVTNRSHAGTHAGLPAGCQQPRSASRESWEAARYRVSGRGCVCVSGCEPRACRGRTCSANQPGQKSRAREVAKFRGYRYAREDACRRSHAWAFPLPFILRSRCIVRDRQSLASSGRDQRREKIERRAECGDWRGNADHRSVAVAGHGPSSAAQVMTQLGRGPDERPLARVRQVNQ
jgi:hypothetical protein